MSVNPQIPDYDLDDLLVVGGGAQLRAIADPLRGTLLELTLERAATVSEMAVAVARPKSTVAYHVNQLVDAGLLRVVRTRRVRAIEERFYGRVARTFYFGPLEHADDLLILHDYLPSQNAWKVRQLLAHLDIPYRQQFVAIFDGEGQDPEFLGRNPTGAVPVLELESGECLAESNAILCWLAEGTAYLPDDRWQRAQVLRWLCFEADYVQSSVATLRHWTLTGKTARREPALVDGKRAASIKVLGMLDRHLGACAASSNSFLVGDRYTIADIAVFAYVHLAADAGITLADFPALGGWIERVQARAAPLARVYPYAIDPHSGRDLP